MSIRISGITEAKAPLGQGPSPYRKIFLAFVLGFSLLSIHVGLKAQDPVVSSKPDAPALAPQTPQTGTSPDSASLAIVISSGDALEVYVYDVPELSREYRVNSAGMIILPLLPKPVQAAGLTTDELARTLEEQFRQAGRLRRPEITVAIKQARNSVVAVDGAVKSPQMIQVSGSTKLIDAISQAGGLSEDAASTITVTRGSLALRALALEGGSATRTVSIDVHKLKDGNDPTSQFVVWPGDRISIEHAGFFYVLGNVMRPGGYNFRFAQEQVNVLQALAIAGDVAPAAKKNKAMIIRMNPKGPQGRDEIALNLKDILDGHAPDPILQANDILYVPSSGSKRALRAFAATGPSIVSGTTTGMILYSRY